MKFIQDVEIQNKKVILRLDLNVTIKNDEIVDDTKIKKSIPTIKYLLRNNNKILIMSHLGKIKEEKDKESNSLKQICERLESLLDMKVKFVSETRGYELEHALDNINIAMMENTRFEDLDGKKESGCDLELSKYWASLGNVFVIDAFGTTHRQHASTYGIGKYIDSYYGYLIDQELKGLEPIINDIKKPFIVVMGGAKVDDKVRLIESLLERCDYLLVGGGIANTFLKSLGYNVGLSLYSEDYVNEIRNLYDKYKNKIWIPIDVVVKEHDEIKKVSIENVSADSTIYDIGDNTINKYKEIIEKSKTIFVNGTMGLYEEEEYRNGTESLYKEFDKVDATIIAGGGDAVSSVNKLGYANAFDFLSTGGGATLEYIADRELAVFKGE